MNGAVTYRQSQIKAFTLIEMLVAIAVLALLTVMITQITSLSSKAINDSTKRIDGLTQARLVLDRIGIDLAARPKRSDLGLSFTKAIGNDQFEFYSEVSGYSGGRHFSVVGYRIQELNVYRYFQLERGVPGTDWSGTSTVLFLPQTLPVIADVDYEIISNCILRLEFCYLKIDGTYSNTAKSDLSDVSAVAVAVAVLDINSRKMITSSQVRQLAAALPDSVEGNDPISIWHTSMSQASFGAGVSQQVIQAIRLYQRVYYAP